MTRSNTESSTHEIEAISFDAPFQQGLGLEQARSALAAEVRRRHEAEKLCGELRHLSLAAREDEQRRLARDLHDQVGQSLTALKLAIVASRQAVLNSAVAALRLKEVERACGDLERGLSEVAERLRPSALDELGLKAAIEQLAATWSYRTGVNIDVETVGFCERLPEPIETALYRFAQEALTNAARHANATRVSVVLQRSRTDAVVSVEDDGVGFDPDAVPGGHFGLIGIRERFALCQGTVQVESGPGAGTLILGRIPLEPPQSAPENADGG